MTTSNQYIALAAHPFLECEDGTRDLIIRKKDAPKTVVVPLLDNHDYEKAPIGVAKLAFIPCAEISDTDDLCVVTALLSTNRQLPPNQCVSIGAPLEKSVANYRIYREILELSAVDKGHLKGAAIIERESWNDVIHALYATAPAILTKVLREVKNAL